MNVVKVTCRCGAVLDEPPVIMVVHQEKEATTHKIFECPCGADPPIHRESVNKISDWCGVEQYLEAARDIGEKLSKPGDYYKPGHYGFTWFNNEIVAIIMFVKGEPEIEPIVDGFGRLGELIIGLEEDEED